MAAEVINTKHEMVSLDRLTEHPANPRHGDLTAVIDSVERNGFFGAIVAQVSTSHVLAGNHRLQAARHLKIDQIPVIWVDVDDERAMRILLADNRTSDLATYDDEALTQLLEHLASTDFGLAGTGYTDEDLQKLLGSEEDQFGDDAGQNELDFEYIIEITCRDEDHQVELSTMLHEMELDHTCRMM